MGVDEKVAIVVYYTRAKHQVMSEINLVLWTDLEIERRNIFSNESEDNPGDSDLEGVERLQRLRPLMWLVRPVNFIPRLHSSSRHFPKHTSCLYQPSLGLPIYYLTLQQ